MKAILTLLLALAAVCTQAQTTFRNTTWGMSSAEVKKVEKAQFSGTEEATLFYKTLLNGLDVSIVYTFHKDKLISGAYYFDVKHVNPNLYIDDYLDMKLLLIEKYGQPTKYDIDWSDKLYKNDVDQWGLAVSAGHLSYNAIWKKDDVTIIHTLSGDNFQISHMIIYVGEGTVEKYLDDRSAVLDDL